MDILIKLNRLFEAEDKKSGKDEIKLKIMDYLKEHPSPPDDDIHDFAEEFGMESHDFEAIIYSILGSFAGSGRAKEKGFEEKDADPKELAMGIKIESEHTSWPPMAKRISLDHLAEIPDYYTRLIKMEKEAGIED